MTACTSGILRNRPTALAKPGVICILLLILTGMVACNKSNPGKSSARSVTNDIQKEQSVPGVKVNQQTQELEGIRVVHPDSGMYRKYIDAYGVVLSPGKLIAFQNKFVRGNQLIRKYKAQLQVTHREYQRMDTLYHHNGTSQKDFEEARSGWVSDEANLAESQQELRTLIDNSRQLWGPVIIHWLQTHSKVINRIIEQQAWLVRVTPSGPLSGRIRNLPETVSLGITKKQMFRGRFISRSPKLDPRFQQAGYYYLVNNPPVDLNPDMNLIVELPAGKPISAIVIPGSAVTWWQGEPWVYVKQGPQQFDRISLAGAVTTGNRWYIITRGVPIHLDDNIVIAGAQFLLEKELQGTQPTVSAGEEGDDD